MRREFMQFYELRICFPLSFVSVKLWRRALCYTFSRIAANFIC